MAKHMNANNERENAKLKAETSEKKRVADRKRIKQNQWKAIFSPFVSFQLLHILNVSTMDNAHKFVSHIVNTHTHTHSEPTNRSDHRKKVIKQNARESKLVTHSRMLEEIGIGRHAEHAKEVKKQHPPISLVRIKMYTKHSHTERNE